jgi:hypothetical protein
VDEMLRADQKCFALSLSTDSADSTDYNGIHLRPLVSHLCNLRNLRITSLKPVRLVVVPDVPQ